MKNRIAQQLKQKRTDKELNRTRGINTQEVTRELNLTQVAIIGD